MKRIADVSIMMALGLGLSLTVGAQTGTPLPAADSATPTASSQAARRLTLDEALAQAAKTNKLYLMAIERESAARAKWWQALLAFGPTGNVQAFYIMDSKPMTMTMDLGGFFSIPGQAVPASEEIQLATTYYSGSVGITQPIFTGFRILSGYTIASLQYESAVAARELACDQMVQDVTQAFYGLLIAQRLLAVGEESMRQIQEHVRIVQARYHEGSASNYDLLRSQVQVANQEPGLIRQRQAVTIARKNLAIVTGLDPLSPIELSGTISVVEENWAQVEDLIARGLADRLELKNVERARRIAEAGATMTWGAYLPSLAASASWTYYDTADAGFPPEGENLKHAWQVGVGLNWTFWDNLAVWPKADEAAARVREAELGRRSLEDNIKLEIESAYLNLRAALETITSQRKNSEVAAEGFRIAEKQYAHGMMTNIDLLDSQLAYNQAQTNFLQAQYDYILAKVRLRRAIGEKLAGPAN